MALSRKQICAGELERDGQDDRTEFLISLGILDTIHIMHETYLNIFGIFDFS